MVGACPFGENMPMSLGGICIYRATAALDSLPTKPGHDRGSSLAVNGVGTNPVIMGAVDSGAQLALLDLRPDAMTCFGRLGLA